MEIFKLMGTVAINKDKALKDIKAVQDQAKRASTEMGGSFTKFSGYVEQHSAQIKKAGKYLTVFGGIAIAAFALSVKSAANFEEQLANVSTMLDASAMKILPEYRKGLQSLSVDFGESTETLSKGLYDILSASIPPAEALGVLEISAKAAAAGITDTGVAADAITTILNSYGMSADQAGMVSDKLFAIVKEGKTTFAELAPSIGKVAATASMAGLNFDDLGACIATMTRAGIRTEETMTAINGVLIAFLKPTDEAKEAAAKFGLTLDTNTLKTEGLTGVMDKLKDATAEQLAAIFPNIRGLKGMAAALGDAEGYAKSYALMLDSAGLTQEAFEKQSATLNFKLGQLKEMFNVIKVTVGTALIPTVEDITKKIMGVLTKVKEWTEANPKLTATIAKWGVGISALMLVAGPLLIALPSLVSGVNLLIGVAPGLVAALGKVKIALAGVAGQTLLIAGNVIIWMEVWRAYQEVAKSTKVTQDDVTDSLIRLSNAQLVAAEKMGIPVQEFVRMQKEGKSVTEMMDTLANKFPGYADALNVWTIAAVEQQVGAKLIVTTVKDLAQEMSLLTKEYGAGSQAISERITYYTDMIDLHNRTDVILQTELMLLEKGTEAYKQKQEEIAENAKGLNEMNIELARLIEPLEGLELINAKLAILGNTSEDNAEKLKLLGEKSIELKQKLDASLPETEEWWKWNSALEANEQSIKDLSNTIAESELTRLGSKLDYLNTKFQEGKQTVGGYKDQISTLNSQLSILKTKLEEAEPESTEYYDTSTAVGDMETKIKDLTTAMNDLILGKDSTKEALEDLGETIEETGEKTVRSSSITAAQLNEAFGGVVKTINTATSALSNFTIAGVAAAIATIKMKFLPALLDLREIMASVSRSFFEGMLSARDYTSLQIFYQRQINDLLKEQKERVDIVLFGWKEYQKILASMEGGAGGTVGFEFGGVIGRLQKGYQRGGGIDNVLIRATAGEYLISKPMTDFIKRTGIVTGGLVEAIASGRPTPIPGMQAGGEVTDYDQRMYTHLVIERGAITIQTPKFSEQDGERLFGLIERKAKNRGLVFVRG